MVILKTIHETLRNAYLTLMQNQLPPCEIVSCGFVIKKFEHQNIYYFYFYFQTIVISPFIYLANIKSFHFEKIELLHSNFISLNDIHS